MLSLLACSNDTLPSKTSSPSGPQEKPGGFQIDTSGDPQSGPQDPGPDPDPDPDPDPALRPELYSSGSVHSPITPFIAERLREIYAQNSALDPNVLMKLGGSVYTSYQHLGCFTGSQVHLEGYNELSSTLDYFLSGNIGGETPWIRNSLGSHNIGSATWLLDGSPSPLEQEYEAAKPKFALLGVGSQDMNLGTSFESAMWAYGKQLEAAVSQLVNWGVIPIIFAMQPRDTSNQALIWSKVYAELARGIAQAHQVPLVDLQAAYASLPQFGLASNGLHHASYAGPNGTVRSCDFSSAGLNYSYNMRNLVTLQALDRLRQVVINDQAPPNPQLRIQNGDGGPEAPYTIDELPYTHHGNTQSDGHRNIDSYFGCDANQDESGPELLYTFSLTQSERIRAFVSTPTGVDVDIHLLDDTATADGCITRGHRIIHQQLPAGTYTIAVDSFTSSGFEYSGEYILALMRCSADDSSCN